MSKEMTIDGMSRADYTFELGKAQTLLGDFLGSIRLLEESAALFFIQKEYSKYMECISIILKIYIELQDHRKVALLKEELVKFAWNKDIIITARIYYSIAIASMSLGELDQSYNELDQAMDQVRIMRKRAEEQNDPAQILSANIESIFPIYGRASYFIRINDLKQASAEVHKLEGLIESFHTYNKYGSDSYEKISIEEASHVRAVLEDTKDRRFRVELTTQILKAIVVRKQGRYEEAERLLWVCYENIQKSRDLCTIVSFFYYLGVNYMDMKDYGQARIFLGLAKKSIDTDNFRSLNSHVVKYLKELDSFSASSFDLIIDLTANSIIEKHKGRIDFKNQFILLDLLRMFLKTPGKAYSKEEMVDQVWKQSYDPIVHDNKIYVTIKRLRELVEPDSHRPRYIFRGKDGYYLNGNTKVLFKNLPIKKQAYIENNGEAVL